MKYFLISIIFAVTNITAKEITFGQVMNPPLTKAEQVEAYLKKVPVWGALPKKKKDNK